MELERNRYKLGLGKQLWLKWHRLLLRKTPETYYFASGDHNGCNHNMKFSVSPIPRSSSHTKP
ncbi:BnaC03g66220D [Brassica napus]|uniref:BnaC03g66220D protein n=1 Tax=Brassica napus TaxID=3708 RepID=A0A078I8Q8_BRANA|nr:BnaC03g66220D [Brassica napus]